MGLGYDIVDEDSQVRVVGTGIVTMSGMIAIFQKVAEDPRFRSYFTVTFDLRKATYRAELADGDALVAVLNQKKTDFQNRLAVVVPESLHLLARLYCALTTLGGFDKIQCFTSMNQAQEWCRKAAASS
jgi:hypothetical protein